MILDVHTHSMISEHWGCEWHNNWEPVYGHPADEVTPEKYDAAMQGVDLSFVFGIKATRAGMNTPHEFVADFVRQTSTNCIGFMALDPSDDDVLEQLRHGVQLGQIAAPAGAPTLAKDTLDWILNGDPRPALGVESW